MIKAVLWIVLLSTMSVSIATANPKPLEEHLNWDKVHKIVPEIKNYRYYYGEISWGKAVYYGQKDLLGLETELQLLFRRGKIVAVTLILGPAGLNDANCIKKYKKVVNLLNKKYGNFQYQKVEKDPMIDDLIYNSICYPMQVGLYSVDTIWQVGDYKITASGFGDAEGFYIELEYLKINLFETHKKESLKKTLKRL